MLLLLILSKLFTNINVYFLQSFFLLKKIKIFIKTKVISHFKSLNLSVNNKKLINLGDLGLLLLPV